MPEWQPDGPYLRTVEAALDSHAVEQINHCLLRSTETFSLKAGTLSPVGLKDRHRPQ